MEKRNDLRDWTVSIVRPADVSVDDRMRWAEIQSTSLESQNPFFTWDYANAAAAFRPNLKVLIFTRNGKGEAFWPMNLSKRYAQPAAAPLCDYQMVIAAPDFSLNLKDVMEAGKIDLFRFNGLIDPNDVFPCVAEENTRYIVDLRNGFDAYFKQLSKKGRQSLRKTRSRRDLASEVYGHVRVEHNAANSDEIEHLFKWKSKQYKGSGKHDILSQDWVYEFLLHMARLQDGKFGGLVSTLYFGDELVAAHLNIQNGPYAQGWIIGYDPDFKHYTPGLILFDDLFRNHKKLGFEVFDFSTGEGQYKRHLSNLKGTACAGFESTSGLRALFHKSYNKIESWSGVTAQGSSSDNTAARLRRRYQQVADCDPTWNGRMKTLADTGLHAMKRKLLP